MGRSCCVPPAPTAPTRRFRSCSSKRSGFRRRRLARQPSPARRGGDVAVVRARGGVGRGRNAIGDVTCETDRARFLGRGRTVHAPRALDDGVTLSGSVGAVLDPIVASARSGAHRAGPFGDRRFHDGGGRRRAKPRCNSPIAIATSRPPIAPRASRGPRPKWSCAISTSSRPTSRSTRSWPAPSSTRTRRFVRRPANERAVNARPVGAVGAGNLRRLADRAGDDPRRRPVWPASGNCSWRTGTGGRRAFARIS